MIELNLISALSNKEVYDKYIHLINTKGLSREAIKIIAGFKRYEGTLEGFSEYFFNVLHPQLDDKAVEKFKNIFQQLITPKDSESIINSFRQQEFYNNLQADIDNNIPVDQLESKVLKFKESFQMPIQVSTEDMDLTLALDTTDRSKGLPWRLKCLREHLQTITLGDFILGAGFVDSGKTSWAISEVSYMAQHLDNEDYILFMSNEGEWTSILPRLYCATLECRRSDLEKNRYAAIKQYSKLMKGNKNRVQIIDIQGWTAKDIEKVIKAKPPKLLIIDLIDNLSGFDKYANKESAGEKYTKLYQWCREISTKICPIIGLTQLNGEGEDEMFPKMSQLRMSRVDKQAACTVQLMIGSKTGDGRTRYLSTPKNKVNGNKQWKGIVNFDPERSLYLDRGL